MRLCVGLRRKCSAHDRLVPIYVGDGQNANAGRLDHVDGVDANARTDVRELPASHLLRIKDDAEAQAQVTKRPNRANP